MALEILCWRALQAVARYRSFSPATAKLNVTLLAVGQKIRKLQSWVGNSLF
ncbi:LysR family transcriptional regulator [Pseudomonas asgharzadehiana]|uniref:LysR family transcriptional regulator n=1 Tax=Pseudomonas asgharzadehiana TaxID=2842349 RepID=A0ABX8P7S5_9PSED|nr:LysR family transcriptional regulator [Pseudomonas asgharzadehiana]